MTSARTFPPLLALLLLVAPSAVAVGVTVGPDLAIFVDPAAQGTGVAGRIMILALHTDTNYTVSCEKEDRCAIVLDGVLLGRATHDVTELTLSCGTSCAVALRRADSPEPLLAATLFPGLCGSGHVGIPLVPSSPEGCIGTDGSVLFPCVSAYGDDTDPRSLLTAMGGSLSVGACGEHEAFACARDHEGTGVACARVDRPAPYEVCAEAVVEVYNLGPRAVGPQCARRP